MSEFFPVAFASFPDAPAFHKFRTHVENNAGMGAFVCHWEDQPAGHSILHLAAVADGVSTVAPVGTLDALASSFEPAPPVSFLPGKNGDLVNETLSAAAAHLPRFVRSEYKPGRNPAVTKHRLTDQLSLIALGDFHPASA